MQVSFQTLAQEYDKLQEKYKSLAADYYDLSREYKKLEEKYLNEVSLVKKLAEENAELNTKLYPFKSWLLQNTNLIS